MFGREPSFWIGLIVTIISGVIATLLGQGVISDVQAGRVNDVVDGIAKVLLAIAPLIATLLTRQVVTPVAAPVLEQGTGVTVTNAEGKTLGHDVVSPA